MREIKFRGWDKKEKILCVIEGYNPYDKKFYCSRYYYPRHKSPFFYIPIERMILMQYTGLKDKNDIEIYEGDIIKFYMSGVGFVKGVVIFHDFSWAIKVGDSVLKFDYFGTNLKNIEVIGNIYEHPELLKGVKE